MLYYDIFFFYGILDLKIFLLLLVICMWYVDSNGMLFDIG